MTTMTHRGKRCSQDMSTKPCILCNDMRLDCHLLCRDADKGDGFKAKPKSGSRGRNKRALEGDEEMHDDEEADAQPRAPSTKTIAKKAKVWPAFPPPPRCTLWQSILSQHTKSSHVTSTVLAHVPSM